jgi:hypothetical protein
MTGLIAAFLIAAPDSTGALPASLDSLVTRYVDTLSVEAPSLRSAITFLNWLPLKTGTYLVRLTTPERTLMLRYIRVPEP